MKIFLLSLGLSIITACASTPNITKRLTCYNHKLTEKKGKDVCIEVLSDGSVQLTQEALKKMEFGKDGLASVLVSLRNNQCFWANKDGRVKKTLCFDNGSDYFKMGLTRHIGANGKMGFMNKELIIVIKPIYDFVSPFRDKVSHVCNGCKSVPIKKHNHEGCNHTILQGGKWAIIDKAGNKLKDCPGNESCYL